MTIHLDSKTHRQQRFRLQALDHPRSLQPKSSHQIPSHSESLSPPLLPQPQATTVHDPTPASRLNPDNDSKQRHEPDSFQMASQITCGPWSHLQLGNVRKIHWPDNEVAGKEYGHCSQKTVTKTGVPNLNAKELCFYPVVQPRHGPKRRLPHGQCQTLHEQCFVSSWAPQKKSTRLPIHSPCSAHQQQKRAGGCGADVKCLASIALGKPRRCLFFPQASKRQTSQRQASIGGRQ